MPQSKSYLKLPIKLVAKSINIEVEVKSKRWLEIANIEKFIQSQSAKLIELSPLKKFLKMEPFLKSQLAFALTLKSKKLINNFVILINQLTFYHSPI